MNERERFRESLLFGKPDKVLLWPGDKPCVSTLAAWHRQGLPEGVDWYDYLMQVLGIQRASTTLRVDLGRFFRLIPTFEEKVLILWCRHWRSFKSGRNWTLSGSQRTWPTNRIV